MQEDIPTSGGQDDNFFSVSSRAATYSVEASFKEYIYTIVITLYNMLIIHQKKCDAIN